MSKTRYAVAGLALSASGFVGIMMHEGYSGEAIQPVPGDVWTVGFGSTQGVKRGDRTTPHQALARAHREVQGFEDRLKGCVKVPLTQSEYDTFVDFSYNVGSSAFCNSQLVEKLNQLNYDEACAELLRWRKYKNKDCSLPENKRLCGGLWTRRQREYQMCMKED